MKLILHKTQGKKLRKILWIGCALCMGVGSFLKVYRDSIHLYLTPSEVLLQKPTTVIRVGGILEKNSLHIQEEFVTFTLKDKMGSQLPIHFAGTPPRLLKEEQDTIVLGTYQQGTFMAQEVLAKHDEYYRPKDSQRSLDPVLIKRTPT